MSTDTTERAMPPHPRRFFIFDSDKRMFVRVKAHSITVPGMEAFDLFIHKGYKRDGWTISEGRSGGQLVNRQTDVIALIDCAKRYATLTQRGQPPLPEQISKTVEKYGLSPRWVP